MHTRFRATVISLVALALGCQTTSGETSPQVGTVEAESTEVSLKFFSPAQSRDAIVDKMPIDDLREDEVVASCKGRDAEIADAAATALAWILKPIFKFIIGKIDDSLQAELKEYAAAFVGTADVDDLYIVGDVDGGPVLRHRCFRLTRRDEAGVAMDFVGKLTIADRESMMVEPIRLYYARAKAKTKGGSKIGVALSLSASATYRHGNEGRFDEDALSAVKLAVESFDPAAGPLYILYDEKARQFAPLIPWSAYEAVAYGGSRARFSANVAEAGEIPWLLDKTAGLFSDKKDDIVDLLVDAAKKAVEGEDGDEGGEEAAGPEAGPLDPVTDLRPALPFPPGVSLETQCGQVDDLQDVEYYVGDLGVTRAYVDTHQSSTVQLQWMSGTEMARTLPGHSPGNVARQRWCTGTLLPEGRVLTAGHCFDIGRGEDGWFTPYLDGPNGRVYAEPAAIARVMQVNFFYQVNGTTGAIRVPVSYPIEELLEYREGSNRLDYAIVRLGSNTQGRPPARNANPGTTVTRVPIDREQIVIIQHPQGQPKKIEAGRVMRVLDPWIYYNDIDTYGGSSGSGILDSNGRVIGVHTNGGCKKSGGDMFDANRGVSMEAIAKVSDIF